MTDENEAVASPIPTRKFYLYGAGLVGRKFVRVCRDLELPFTPEGFLDNNPDLSGSMVEGYPVHPPRRVAETEEAPYVVVASFRYRDEIIRDCLRLGYQCVSLNEFIDMFVVPYFRHSIAIFKEAFYTDGTANLRLLSSDNMIIDDYVYNQKPRSTENSPSAKFLDNAFSDNCERIISIVRGFFKYAEAFSKIPLDPSVTAPMEPYWMNGWISPLDGISIYAMLATEKPRRYIEIGSGNTTKFAARSIRDNALSTEIISIDPRPRADIDTLCSHVFRTQLEEMDMSFFETITSADMVILDSSHRAFTNSDVTVFFTEILPMLPRGVLYAIHDISLPNDYPKNWVEAEKRHYNEQYVLAAYLLGGGDGDQVELPLAYLSTREDTARLLNELWMNCIALPPNAPRTGAFFWMRRRTRVN